MTDIIVVPPVATTPSIGITEAGLQIKHELLQEAGTIPSVESIATRDSAIDLAARIKKHLKEIEANRQEVLKPFHATTSAINGVARRHTMVLEANLHRLNRLAGEFEEARQKAAWLESKRLAEEASELALPEPQEKNREMTDEEKAGNLLATMDAEEKLADAASKIQVLQSKSAAEKARGGALRRDWDIIVTDIKALYAAHPQCVTMAPSLLAIKDLLKAGITPPGVLATPKVAYAARAK